MNRKHSDLISVKSTNYEDAIDEYRQSETQLKRLMTLKTKQHTNKSTAFLPKIDLNIDLRQDVGNQNVGSF